jgi:hypothetical protein
MQGGNFVRLAALHHRHQRSEIDVSKPFAYQGPVLRKQYGAALRCGVSAASRMCNIVMCLCVKP